MAILTPVLLIGGMTTGLFTPTEGAIAASLGAVPRSRLVPDAEVADAGQGVDGHDRDDRDRAVHRRVGVDLRLAAHSDPRHRRGRRRGCSRSRSSPWVFLLLANLLMLFVGCFLEPTAAITILVPMLMPIVPQLGIDPVHFGLVMVLNLMIGLLHPPMGMVLFVLARVRELSFERTTMAILPWLVPLLASLVADHLRAADRAVAAEDVLSRGAHERRSNASRSCRSTCAPKVKRSDAIQAFVTQETPMVRIALRRRRAKAPATRTRSARAARRSSRCCATTSRRRLDRPRCPDCIEAIWKDLFFDTHATAVGAITSSRAGGDRHGAVGPQVPARRLAAVEGGGRRAAASAGLHDGRRVAAPFARSSSSTRRSRRRKRVFAAPRSRSAGRTIAEDVARLAAVREAVGDAFEIMVDANQAFTVAEARRRAHAYAQLGLAWFEEPLPAEDLARPRRARREGDDADRRRRIAVPPGAFPRIPGARRLLDRPGGLRAHRRHHAVAQGRAPRRDIQRRRLPALPDGTARVAHGGRAERRVGRIHPATRRRSRRRGMAMADGYAIAAATRRASASTGITPR